MNRLATNLTAVALACLVAAGCGNKQQPAAGPQQQQQSLATTQPKPAPDGVKNAALNKWLRETEVTVPPATYRVAPPDAIKITAPGIKELDQSEATIRSDGKITVNLIGEVYVAGLSPAEISDELARRAATFYNKESTVISVEVTQFESKKFYVFGQVFEPGVKPYTGSDSVVKVLADARLNDDAWPQKVVLIRPNDDASIRQRVTIDLKQMFQDGKADQNYLIEEGDLIYVPPSPLAEFRITFERLLAPIMPVADFAMLATGGF